MRKGEKNMKCQDYFVDKNDQSVILMSDKRIYTVYVGADRKAIKTGTEKEVRSFYITYKEQNRKPTYIEDLKQRASSVSLHTRQKLLDLLHEGKTLGEVRKELNLDLDVVGQIIMQNLDSLSYLRTEAV